MKHRRIPRWPLRILVLLGFTVALLATDTELTPTPTAAQSQGSAMERVSLASDGTLGNSDSSISTINQNTNCSWSGQWDTGWNTGTAKMELTQAGDSVNGNYDFRSGRIRGTVTDNELTGTWLEAPSYSPPNYAGDFRFTMAPDCNSFTGVWRFGSSGTWYSWSGTRAGGAHTPPPSTPLPTPAPTPSPDENVCGTRPAQSRTVGNLTVHANSFNELGRTWDTSGTIWLGDYTVVSNGNLSFRGDALSGNGLVSLAISDGDKGECKPLFAADFEMSGNDLTVTDPDYEWQVNSVVGFSVEEKPTQIVLDVKEGRLDFLASLALVIPDNERVKAVGISLDHTGAFSGVLRDTTFQLGGVNLQVMRANLGNDGFTLNAAELVLPSTLGGARAELTVKDVRITGEGEFTLLASKATFNFPNIYVGNDGGFSIEGAQASVTYDKGTYLFQGIGTFSLPGVGKGSDDCKLGTEFTLASEPPPVRQVKLSLSGCVKMPIASTGFFLTKVGGEVTLDEKTVAINLNIGIESLSIPGLSEIGPVVSAEPSAGWDDSWKVAMAGSMKIFSFDVLDAAVELSQAQGFKGTIQISVLGILTGESTLRVWRDTSGLQITGRGEARLEIAQGEIFEECLFGMCVSIPPGNVNELTGMDFGAFRQGSSTIYGIKGYIDLFGYRGAFFIDAEGDFEIGDDVTRYALATPPDPPANLQSTSELREFTIDAETQALIIALAYDRGSPTLRLVPPDNQSLDASSPNVVVTTSVTQTLLTVPNPQQGNWQVHIENLAGDENFHIVALGARPLPTVSIPTINVGSNNSFNIDILATSSTPTSTVSLFYDTSPISRTGKPITQGLPLTTTSYTWQPEAIVADTYYIYAMVDDPLGGPAYKYVPTPITITDSTPPDTPTKLRVTSSDSTALITWEPSTAPDVVGYRIYYREPQNGTTFVSDVPDGQQTTYEQLGLYLDGFWDISISAYDINENESERSAIVSVSIGGDDTTIYLPIIVR